MLNRDRHILLNLRYSGTVNKATNFSASPIENIEPSSFYDNFTKSLKNEYFHQGGEGCLDTLSSQERLNQLLTVKFSTQDVEPLVFYE